MSERRALRAWALYDWAHNGYSTVVLTFAFAAYFTGRVAENTTTGTAQWGRTIAAASGLIALGAPLLGAIADRGGRNRMWLALFTGLAVASIAGLAAVRPDPSDAGMALALVGCAALTSGFAIVFYDALLPELAPAERIGSWSGFGWGLGYFGGLACLGIALLAFLSDSAWLSLDRERGLAMRATCGLAAAWYGVFALPLLLSAPASSGPPVPVAQAVRGGLRQLRDSIRGAARSRGLIRFLLARMLYADGMATLFALGGVYAAGTFELGSDGLARLGIALSATAGAGAWLFARVDDRLGGKRTIALGLAGLLIAGAAVVAAPGLGLFWGASLALGFFVGPVQAASRSYLARVAPRELRRECFGLYALSGKATAFAGPLLVGEITAWTGSQRVGMSAILVLFALGLALLIGIPADRPSRGGSGDGAP